MLNISAQSSMQQEIYSQLPAVPDILICENAESYSETTVVLESLLNQLEVIGYQLEEETKIIDETAYNELTSDFPTAEELDAVEKLSEEEQKDFWAKIELNQTKFEETSEKNKLKYRAEKEILVRQLNDYNERYLNMNRQAYEKQNIAMKVKSDKMQNIYSTCMGTDNKLTEYGKQQIDKIKIEFCEAVSSSYLKALKFEYAGLKLNMSAKKRLAAIEIMEYSPLSEEDIYNINKPALDLTEIGLLIQFINNYKIIFEFLPGSNDK